MTKFSQNILIQYLQWHFISQPRVILKNWKVFLLFNLNYWSIHLLLKTLFSHWRRYRYSYGKRFDLKKYFEVFTFNMMSRFMGTIVRIVFIFLGILTELLIIIIGLIIFLLWLILPILLIIGIFLGFMLLFL